MGRLKILLLFTAFSLIIFWPIFFGKVNLNGNLLVSFYAPYGENLPYKNSGWDQLRIYFPFYKFTLDSFKSGMIPVWNPFAFSGHPHMADFQTAVFYPLNIFGFFLSQIEFWHLLRITPAILAAFFTFLYLRSLHLSFPRKRESNNEIPDQVGNDRGQAWKKEGRGLSYLASIFGALTFGFSPFILTWGEEVVMSPHSIVWLPLILWAIEKLLSLRQAQGIKKHLYFAVIALATAFSFFGGYMQTSIYMFIFVAAYLIFRVLQINGLQARLVKLFQAGLGIILGAGIAAVQLLPSAELFFNAARSQVALREQLFNFLLPVESLFTYLAPDFFGHPATANFFRFGDAQYYEGILFVGVAALIFAGHLIIREWHRGFVRFMAISGLVALIGVIDWLGAKLFLSLPIPFLSTSIPNRVLFIPAFSLAVLAAGGLDGWITGKFEIRNNVFTRTKVAKFEIFRVVLVIAGIYAGILATLLWTRVLGFPYFESKQFLSEVNWLVTVRNLVVPLAVFAAVVVLVAATIFLQFKKQVAAVLIMVISFLHIFYFSQKYFSFSDRKYIFPKNDVLKFIAENQGLDRSWGTGEAFLENNFATQYGIFWPEGYDSLNNRSYGEFTYAMQGANLDDFVFRADAGLGRGNTVELLGNWQRRKLLDLVGVKYVIGKVDEQGILEKYGFRKVFDPPSPASPDSEGKYAVYENLTVLPRAFLASNYEGPPDVFGREPETEIQRRQRDEERRKLIPQKLLGEDFDFRNVIILEKPSPISAQFGPGTAQISSYKPQEVVIKTNSGGPKILFLSDNWYPGWKATVDGDETEIWRANYTFRAVSLTPGEHQVRFYYDSWVFKVGLIISIVSLGILVWILFKPKLSIFNFQF
ncbi:YfhO family protein [Candidatus Curtissbacteria bacterium]|nr:YfhO family protein [Candidatus Curtissbacteria bacterium]